MLDVGAKAEQAIAKAEKAVMVYARPDKAHWTEDMAASIARLASVTGRPLDCAAVSAPSWNRPPGAPTLTRGCLDCANG